MAVGMTSRRQREQAGDGYHDHRSEVVAESRTVKQRAAGAVPVDQQEEAGRKLRLGLFAFIPDLKLHREACDAVAMAKLERLLRTRLHREVDGVRCARLPGGANTHERSAQCNKLVQSSYLHVAGSPS